MIASFTALFEQMLYVSALTLVVTHLSDPWRILAYAAGYAVGTLVGSWVEDRIAVGNMALHIITTNLNMAGTLRSLGVAVTSWEGLGRDGTREVLLVVIRRKTIREVMEEIHRVDPNAFVTRTELHSLAGGFVHSRRLFKMNKWKLER
ncbi:DUF5698 domain-containing protein [Fodinisporobacter ferrooxydans]|uniref:DUF5698 domain-containing protein n=1 Tax=Fodinisporobacter ferrooxydans TaxID=2901836 RepID=A0ABY4CEQ6_9BACL|nr:DUF5698 domain-containing protein [Alicyclobacillaceae bacterium MYW30-H2]